MTSECLAFYISHLNTFIKSVHWPHPSPNLEWPYAHATQGGPLGRWLLTTMRQTVFVSSECIKMRKCYNKSKDPNLKDSVKKKQKQKTWFTKSQLEVLLTFLAHATVWLKRISKCGVEQSEQLEKITSQLVMSCHLHSATSAHQTLLSIILIKLTKSIQSQI